MKHFLTLPFLLLTVLCFGQSKIGNLTVDDKVFKEYLFDCYNRPDTVYAQNQSSYIHAGMYSQSDLMQANGLVEAYNKQLERIAIGKLEWSIPQRYLVPRKPSEIDFIKYLKRTSQ